MNIKILNEKENKLIGRKEYEILVENPGPTVSKESLLPEVCKALKCDEGLMVILQINQVYGAKHSIARVDVYNSEDILKQYRREEKAVEEKTESEEAPSETSEESPTEEAPKEKTEEAKEDSPADEKPAEEAKEADNAAEEK
jgi:ribosomal protein S24E